MSDAYNYDEEIDLDEIPDPSNMPEGDYAALITGFDRFESAKGKPCVWWRFKVLYGPYANLDLSAVTILPLGPFAAEARPFKRWMAALGIEGGRKMSVSGYLQEALEQKCILVIKRKENNQTGIEEATIQNIKPWDEGPGVSGPTPDEEI